MTMRDIRRLLTLLLLTVLAAAASADVVSVETTVGADSVTVGERFTVVYDVTYPDSLRMMPPPSLETEGVRVLSVEWRDAGGSGMRTRQGTVTAITLDLGEASIPPLPFEFVTPAGDTVREHSRPVTVPVRYIAADTADLRPLKDPWEAPRSLLAWVAVSVAAVLAGAMAWWLWRRRRARPAVEAPKAALPSDYVALSELTRIERMELLERAEFKEYYTRVVDVLRRYLEARFHVEALDRTTGEVLAQVRVLDIQSGSLEALLREADLVKFARYLPDVESGRAAMRIAREFVAATAPRHVPPHGDDPGAAKEQVG
jgi:hypothetical protein